MVRTDDKRGRDRGPPRAGQTGKGLSSLGRKPPLQGRGVLALREGLFAVSIVGSGQSKQGGTAESYFTDPVLVDEHTGTGSFFYCKDPSRKVERVLILPPAPGKGAAIMKPMNMITRRSFLKAVSAAAVVSALGLTGCGSSASGTAASSAASGAAASSAAASAEAGRSFKVGIVNYVDHASLNQIVASVESRLDELGKEKGVTFDYADYYANAQADQSNLNQIGADLVADGVDVIVAVATPTAATMLAAVEDTDIPVVYSAVTDPVSAGFDGEENITGTSDALNTDAIMNLIVAMNPDIDTIGLLYDLSQDSSTQAIADAKAFCDSKGIKYIEKNGTTTAEVQMAAEALIAAGVKAVFTPTDNTVMTAELSLYESFLEAGVQHYTGADSFALNGAFVGYGVDYVQLGEATADMVSELLCDGKTTADLPYRTFDNGIVTINTESCEALGLDLAAVKEAFKPYCTEIVEVTTQENF